MDEIFAVKREVNARKDHTTDAGNLTFDGIESKILVSDYVFGVTNTKTLYSTTEFVLLFFEFRFYH
jgi:hypothetical protein